MTQISDADLLSVFKYDPETGFVTRNEKLVGSTNSLGYPCFEYKDKSFYVHRFAFLFMTGSWPEQTVDHTDGNRANNAWSNLREASHVENQRNKGLGQRNKSGVKNVSWHAGAKKWRARMKIDGTYKHLGFFETLEEAEQVVRGLREIHHGEFTNHGSDISPRSDRIDAEASGRVGEWHATPR